GTFRPPVRYAVARIPVGLVAGDFNGDGRTDLAVADAGAVDSNFNLIPGTGSVSVLLSNGDGTFQAPVSEAAGPSPGGLVAGDFNGDGRTDLAVANAGDNTVSVLLGNGDGTFRPPVRSGSGPTLAVLGAGDVNGDGRTDLAVGTGIAVSVL